ncbi:UDP-N-acetylglucosamine 2-epimerase (non-hydrolyzing) [Enterococcus hulanensis]|uniref:UDP-N-acetylglucosamine 2-epimerase (non-hydrolyzing) n=1 Tax=Enterococcus hulanensis TaxID=2559929 RepID=A0ABU3F0N8_9ENTE|nr:MULTISPECIES: UDP-N-acetylglucosamine 2-epimerase (non-hydrolyzing) [Enterococcus]MBX8935961.1 UDP-N-acetylglucosamine 2-epimerase (non-hydrolyzing) [Enterococcus gilvus]MDT2600695.1 UDP-N-acetylglucosamine 2-epimerase (non-hydrolyzing) [Enterococcus hulanensis]MDT2610218.1 UDP-N-acetylglucosamine 2-epimerase (non-hydrolyzing) [Enterococcus hulanensis]MDT2617374.1 UDP-N-acetylglucosamine 2-epimerase (non-hydrolyzing) [Enterococcus hulanensis]MDT2628163.1 UDP-N-acetylglucosamine 2-epimerase 
MVVFGTRPEAIKMAPLVKALEKDSRFKPIVVVTGQHRQMLDQVLKVFSITPDYDLNIMEQEQTLTSITMKVLAELDAVLKIERPDMVLVHGDTTTTFSASLSAFYNQIAIGHVEAGLRTWDKYSPFPEEMNRQLTDVMTDLYFAPTNQSKENLLKENHPDNKIFVTGNTAIDAMRYTVTDEYNADILSKDKKNILITMHRRENLGKSMENVFHAVNRLVAEFEDIQVIFPIHKNPAVRKLAADTLTKTDRIKIIEPLDVIDFHNIASRCYLILTDSGGVQEEAPSLGVPVLVLRDTTERPEGIAAGTLKLVGTEEDSVYKSTKELLLNMELYKKMSTAKSPYGDGYASERILDAIYSSL